MKERNIIGDLQLYAKVVATYCSCKMLKEASEVLLRVKADGIQPNFSIFKIILDQLPGMDDKKEAIQLLNNLKRIMHDSNIDIPVHYWRLEESIRFGDVFQDTIEDQSTSQQQEEGEENNESEFPQFTVSGLDPEQIKENMNFTLKVGKKQ